MGTVHTNWSQTVTYAASEVVSPTSVAELQEVVAGATSVKALGSKHSFSLVADTEGTQVRVDRLPAEISVDADAGTVRSSAGLTHAQLSTALFEQGLALRNLASLPHISVAGAIQTGTHGSGVANAGLHSSVTALELVAPSGELRVVRRGEPDFDAVVVGLGAFGVITHVTQQVVPTFEVAQTVHEQVPWEALLPVLEDVMSSGYSVSLFTDYAGSSVGQVWVKQRVDQPARDAVTELGGLAATRTLHPLPDTAADSVNDQLGNPGPSHQRLPHFREDFTPSKGEEIQSEYFVPVERGVEAIEALRALSDTITPALFVAEVRRIAPDPAWLSPSGERDSLALHFTWKRDPERVERVLHDVETALLPLGARPHWGKVFVADHAALAAAYPRLTDFAALVAERDPDRVFANAFLDRVLGR